MIEQIIFYLRPAMPGAFFSENYAIFLLYCVLSKENIQASAYKKIRPSRMAAQADLK